MAIDISKVPRNILKDVRDYVRDNGLAGRDPTDSAIDGHIMSMTSDDLIEAWLQWNGIIGWTQSILSVVDHARGAEYH